jgi:predicted nucleic acid-binding protein
MKSLVFDTGAIISLATNNLLWILEPLKLHFKGDFVIPQAVKTELIDNPLKSYRFRLEAMQVLSEVVKNNIKIYYKEFEKEKNGIEEIVNSIFIARGKFIKVAHPGEISVLALAKQLNAEALVIDERTIRILIEDPKQLAKLLSRRLHTEVGIDKKRLKRFRDYTKNMRVIRSAELGLVAYELGLLNKYLIPEMTEYVGQDMKRKVLEGLLWGLKLRGCAISKNEINDLLKIEGFTQL